MPTPLTLKELRQMSGHLPENYKLVVRDLDCNTMEWTNADVVLMGVTDANELLFLSEAHEPIAP